MNDNSNEQIHISSRVSWIMKKKCDDRGVLQYLLYDDPVGILIDDVYRSNNGFTCCSDWITNNDHRSMVPVLSVKTENPNAIVDAIEITSNPEEQEASQKRCDYCGENFYFVTRLVAHLRIIHGILRPFKCRNCEKTYPHQFLLNAHVKKLHTPKTVSCVNCDFMGVSLNDVERHRKRSHPSRSLMCEICGETFVNDEKLMEHTTMHDFTEFQHCQICGTTFEDSRTLRDHNLHYHYDPAITTAEENHEKIVKENSENRCEICNKIFKYKSILKQHMTRSHGEPTMYEKRLYLCATCGKELKTSKGLEIHNRSHTGEKPYACEICGKCFACETLLRTHSVTHTGEKKYSCDECGKCFTQRSTLVVHKRYHSGERPYVCTRCGKGFVTRTVLKTHMKSCRL